MENTHRSGENGTERSLFQSHADTAHVKKVEERNFTEVMEEDEKESATKVPESSLISSLWQTHAGRSNFLQI